METFSALLALCEGNSPVTGEFPSQRPVTRIFDVFFDLRMNTRLTKQWRCRWFETPPRSLWRHCNVTTKSGHAIYHIAINRSFIFHGLMVGPRVWTFLICMMVAILEYTVWICPSRTENVRRKEWTLFPFCVMVDIDVTQVAEAHFLGTQKTFRDVLIRRALPNRSASKRVCKLSQNSSAHTN